MKLNLGCGFDKEEGYINVDMSPECFPDVVWNMENTPWPWEDNSVDEIKLQHVLEHVGQTSEAYLNIWKEIWRVCQNGAVLHIRVPHWDHENFSHDPTHIRPITPIGIAMFNQLRNIADMQNGGSETKLGLFTGVDIDITDDDVEYMYTSEAIKALERGEFTREGLEHLRVHQNNIANEIRMTARVVKPARGTQWLAAYKQQYAAKQNKVAPMPPHTQNPLSLDDIQLLEQHGMFEEAYKYLQLLPTNTEGLSAKLGWHKIRLGDFKEGFPLLHQEIAPWRPEHIFSLPLDKELTSEVKLSGKKIFIAPEGGLGDEIIAARFVELYKKAGAYVILGAAPSLHTVFARLPFPPDEIRNPETVQSYEYDYWAGSLRAPVYLKLGHPSTGLTLPYLSVDEKHQARWEYQIKSVAQGKLKIGIRWQGKQPENSNQLRVESVPLESLLQLQELGQVFSFQQERAVSELSSHPTIYDLGSQLTSWEDTLACLSQMDVMVTCCTSTAHAAGAMGVPTCVITTMNPYFTWIGEEKTSMWYPSVRVFKQPYYGAWTEAVTNAKAYIVSHQKPSQEDSTMDANELFAEAVEAGNSQRFDVAENIYKQLLTQTPQENELYHRIRYNLSWYEYKNGNIATASKYRVESGRALGIIISATRLYDKPKLSESTDVTSKTILLSSECGAGDEILSVRFAKILKQRGAKHVIWVSSHGLESVFARVEGIDEALSPEEAAKVEFDYWVLTLELPYLLNVTKQDIQTPPYITPDQTYVEKWQKKLGAKLGTRIGIRWKGEKERDASQKRALPFSKLESITRIPGVTTYSLQRDSGHEDLPSQTHVIDAGKDLHTWEDTIALISLLDVVITSDTSIAHLACALGKDTYVVTRLFPYFTWITNAESKTPWYASATVFIEEGNGKFEVPMAEIQKILLQAKSDSIPQKESRSSFNSEETTILAEYPHTHMKLHVHKESELLSNVLRIQKWYSKRDLQLFDLFLKEGDVCIDAGANIGWYSLYAAHLVGSSGKVIAIEPEKKNFLLLQENIAENNLSQVESLQYALGRESQGVTRVFTSPDNFGDHFIAEEDESFSRESSEVPKTNIDTLVQKLGRQPRFIKIDVQGSEVEVLAGMRETLNNEQKPVILVEFAPACMKRIGHSPFEFFAFIDSHSFIPYKVCDDYSGKPLLAPLSIQDLLEFTKENREKEVGWDIILIPPSEQDLLASPKGIKLFS